VAYFKISRAWRVCASVTVNGADNHQTQQKQRVSARRHVVTFVIYIYIYIYIYCYHLHVGPVYSLLKSCTHLLFIVVSTIVIHLFTTY
jgi:hypothetical protein